MNKLQRGVFWNLFSRKDVELNYLLRRSFSISSHPVRDLASKDGELRVFIVAGEVSGDIIGSRFMDSLRKLSPFPVRFAGVGGYLMSKQGLNSLFPMEDISVMGIWELLPHLNNFRVQLKQTVQAALSFQPHVVLTVDSKGFSFRFLKYLRGHPTLEDMIELKEKGASGEIQGNGEEFRSEHGIASGSTVISLLPGSRVQEVTRMLPIFSNTMELLKDAFGELVTVVHIAPNQYVKDYISKAVCKWPVPVVMVSGGSPSMKYKSFSASRVALCTSGTVAVELQLARLPCVVAYRAHLLTEWVIRSKAKVPYISLPNILLKSATIPEALFQGCTPSKLASLVRELVHNENLREQQIAAAAKVIELLSPGKGLINNSTHLETSHALPNSVSSMIAALTVLQS
ncbi:probable lipid-A-disaccharide synthase, mitochondrial isoform X2 [Coffea arabica]|uniref:lipid-A-disaccharide synthase n=1 Tax=Coffea arabica TaxID=13443 RepID=A0A6P6S7V5_COFAR|nr:probable lipid-A-disaccharide synthase, mitochondrial isoform X2 [Coffea arabica]